MTRSALAFARGRPDGRQQGVDPQRRRLGFDGIWLNAVDRAGFERALELVPGLHAL